MTDLPTWEELETILGAPLSDDEWTSPERETYNALWLTRATKALGGVGVSVIKRHFGYGYAYLSDSEREMPATPVALVSILHEQPRHPTRELATFHAVKAAKEWLTK